MLKLTLTRKIANENKMKVYMDHNKNSVELKLSLSLFLLYLLWLLLHLLLNLQHMTATLEYSDWGLSDMLINYQGGFVRRGLLGELMYRIYEVYPYDVGAFVLALIIISAVGCMGALYTICRRMSFSPVLAFSGFTLQFMALAGVTGIRRDYLSLLLCLLTFYLYRKWQHTASHRYLWYIMFQSVMVFTVLLHEGAWFYTTPLICTHLLMWSRRYQHCSWAQSIVRSLSFASPVGIVMALLFMHKGSNEVAQTIWQSWQPLFVQYPLHGTPTPEIGASVACLACTTMDFVRGCGLSLWGLTYWGWLPMLPLTFALFPILIYLVTNANQSRITLGYALRPIDKPLLTTIMFLQLLFMLPLFLFLSCDYGRLFCYWIISSLFAYYLFREDKHSFPEAFQRLSIRFQQQIDRVPFLHTPLGYVLVLVLTPCNMVGGAALGAIPLYRMIHETPELITDFLSASLNIVAK